MVAAAPPTPPPATAAPALRLHHPLPQPPPVALLVPPLLKGRGGDALPPARPVGAAEVAAPTGTVVRRSGTGGGAVQKDQAATRKTAAFPGSAGVTGLDPDPETEAGRGPETAAVAAETGGIRRGKGAGSAGTAVTVEAANTNKRPLAETKTGGEKGVEAMTKRKTPRKRRIKIMIKKRKPTKRRRSLKLRRREAL